jgi:formylglycine-generating enzyme required for sulfatase activity
MRKTLRAASALLAFTFAWGASAQDKPKVATEEIKIPNSVVKFDMVQVPGGKVTIKDKDGNPREVTVKPFSIGKTEVTWDEYDIYWQRMDLSPEQRASGFDAENRPSKPYSAPDRGWGHAGYPAGSIHPLEAQKYVKWLSKITNKKYRLPTEAEWQYACQAGGADKDVSDKSKAKDQGWSSNDSDDTTHDVGKKKANAWGLMDMLGNVCEWVVKEDGTLTTAGGSYMDEAKELGPETRAPYVPEWQRDDPQDPKGKSWMSNGAHVGIRVVRED